MMNRPQEQSASHQPSRSRRGTGGPAVAAAARAAVLGLGLTMLTSGCFVQKPKEVRYTVNGVEMDADGRPVIDPGKRGAVPMTRPIADPWGPSVAARGMETVRPVPVNIFG